MMCAEREYVPGDSILRDSGPRWRRDGVPVDGSCIVRFSLVNVFD